MFLNRSERVEIKWGGPAHGKLAHEQTTQGRLYTDSVRKHNLLRMSVVHRPILGKARQFGTSGRVCAGIGSIRSDCILCESAGPDAAGIRRERPVHLRTVLDVLSGVAQLRAR